METGSLLGATNLTLLSGLTNISKITLRRVFLHEEGKRYATLEYEVWQVAIKDIHFGKARGRGFKSKSVSG